MQVFSSRVYCDAGEDDRHEKDVVRGYTFAEYHADVYDKTESEVTGAGLDCECLGGGGHAKGEGGADAMACVSKVWGTSSLSEKITQERGSAA